MSPQVMYGSITLDILKIPTYRISSFQCHSIYFILELLGLAFIRGRRLKEVGVYLKKIRVERK